MSGSFSPAKLREISATIKAAWIGPNSSPFLAETALPDDLAEAAREALRRVPLHVIFQHGPTLAIWGILRPLLDRYGEDGTIDVYPVIQRAVRCALESQPDRDLFKFRYRLAARKIGIPVSGTHPSDLFFPPLGPPHRYHQVMARAFTSFAFWFGPPAIEDTASARSWQRRAIDLYAPNIPRLQAPIRFDLSAHCARRFEAWRRGEDPISTSERNLFACYDAAMAAQGRSREDIVGPPKLFWVNDHLALRFEKSRHRQSIQKSGDAFPRQITGGALLGVSPPWTAEISWSHRQVSKEVNFAPTQDVLVFDADTGGLLQRVPVEITEVEVTADRLVILAGEDFESRDFGPALPAKDPSFRVAWTDARDRLTFAHRSALSFRRPTETALWISGPVIGRSAGHVLYGGGATIQVQLDPEVGGHVRVLRASFENGECRHASITVDPQGQGQVPLSLLRLDQPGVPGSVLFELLAPGAGGGIDERAELSTRAWIWPGVMIAEDGIGALPRPENLVPGHCAGLRLLEDRIEADLSDETGTQILGLASGGKIRSFEIAFNFERLWHCRVEAGDRRIVPRGTTLILGTEARHDTLRLRSSDRDADLLVLGKRVVRPFFGRGEWEIGAGDLESVTTDDRIALARKSGRIDVLTRIQRLDNPSDLFFLQDDGHLHLAMDLPADSDALEVTLERIDGETVVGQIRFGHVPTEHPPLAGVLADLDLGTGRLSFSIDLSIQPGPGRLRFRLRRAGSHAYAPLRDGDLRPICLGLPDPHPDRLAQLSPQAQSDWLGRLAQILADPTAQALSGQVRQALDPLYRSLVESLGAKRMLRPLLPVLNVRRTDGEIPRNDLLGVAPWILDVPPSAYASLEPGSSLSGLAQIPAFCPISQRPDPEGDRPLSDWLDRLGGDAELPPGLAAEDLLRATEVLRNRIRRSDLRALVDQSAIGRVMTMIGQAYSADLGALRQYDPGGGADEAVIRIVATLERLARASTRGGTADYLARLVERTGLSIDDIGRSLTLALRGGIEVFIYFRTLWAPDAAATPAERQTP